MQLKKKRKQNKKIMKTNKIKECSKNSFAVVKQINNPKAKNKVLIRKRDYNDHYK